MGRSGTNSLWSSGLNCSPPQAHAWGSSFAESISNLDCVTSSLSCEVHRGLLYSAWPIGSRLIKSALRDQVFQPIHQSYRVKPHGQLVLVSLTHYCASTPNLSTSWSTTTLQGAQGPGKTHLETSFPLRCFQRLSLPHLATRQCHWRDNRYTRGVSTPVLSY